MATTKKEKKTVAGVKTTKGSKTSKTKEQIAKLEKALENVDEKNMMDLLPEEVKADILKNEDLTITANDTPVDFDAEVKKIFENPEPSDEVKQQITEFEEGKEKFNENLTKEPEKAEELIKEEIKRVEGIKKKAEALQKQLHGNKKNPDSRIKDDVFTNIWNGMSYGF